MSTTKIASRAEIFNRVKELVEKSNMSKEAQSKASDETQKVENQDSTKQAEATQAVQAEGLDNKEAQAVTANGTAASVPGKDTNFQSVSGSHENHDKNSIGADKHGPQHHEQHKQTDPSTPVKSAENVEKLGQDILSLIEKFGKAVTANNSAASVPGKDTNFQSVSASTEKTDKNSVGADKNGPQKHEQHKQTDPSTPVKTGGEVSAEEQEKIASEALGRSMVQLLAKQAADREIALLKEAGRRDFEQLVALASAELSEQPAKTQKTASAVDLEKQAEEEGAAYFQQLQKQAQFEQFLLEVKALEDKHAALQAEAAALRKQAAEAEAYRQKLEKQAADDEMNRKLVAMAELVSQNVLSQLRQEANRA